MPDTCISICPNNPSFCHIANTLSGRNLGIGPSSLGANDADTLHCDVSPVPTTNKISSHKPLLSLGVD